MSLARRKGLTLYCLGILIAACSLAACSLPRIIVLDDPLSPEEHLALGVAYEKKGEWEAALKEYRSAAPHLPAALVYMGNVYFAEGETEKAEEQYREALRKDPGNADACNNLAWVYFKKRKNLSEALQLARRALALNPAKRDIYRDTIEQLEQAVKEGGAE